MENKKVSIVMPVYNAAQYLSRSIQCILGQTYRNIELILINDGSVDGSERICEEYAQQDSRIVYVSQSNHGQGYTRSRGVELATGDFIAFFDDDDRCLLHMYETMVKAIERDNADICVCQWNYEALSGQHTINNKIYDSSFYGVMSSIEFARYLYKYEGNEAGYGYANSIVVSPWNKLFRRDVIKGVKCSGFLGEDEEMNDWVNSKNVIVTVIPDELYYWCQNLDSMSNKPFSEKKYHFLDMLIKRCEIFDDEYILNKSKLLFCNLIVEYWFNAEDAKITPPISQRKLLKKYVFDLLKSKSCSLKFYLRMMLFSISSNLYKKVLLSSVLPL